MNLSIMLHLNSNPKDFNICHNFSFNLLKNILTIFTFQMLKRKY